MKSASSIRPDELGIGRTGVSHRIYNSINFAVNTSTAKPIYFTHCNIDVTSKKEKNICNGIGIGIGIDKF